MTTPARIHSGSRALTAREFQGLSDVPPELEWFANIPNAKTREAYRLDITDFTAFDGIDRPEEFRVITRAHVIAWRTCAASGARSQRGPMRGCGAKPTCSCKPCASCSTRSL